jgi:hypothetical protein
VSTRRVERRGETDLLAFGDVLALYNQHPAWSENACDVGYEIDVRVVHEACAVAATAEMDAGLEESDRDKSVAA